MVVHVLLPRAHKSDVDANEQCPPRCGCLLQRPRLRYIFRGFDRSSHSSTGKISSYKGIESASSLNSIASRELSTSPGGLGPEISAL